MLEAKDPGMSGVHERNLRNGERVLQNLRANMASDMPPEDVFLSLLRDIDTVDLPAYLSHTGGYPEDYPEVEEPRYSNVLLKMVILRRAILDCFNGKVTSDEALVYISKRMKISLAQKASNNPEPIADDRGSCYDSAQDAPTSVSMTMQQEVVNRLESFREELTRLRDLIDRALSSEAYAYTAHPLSAFMGLLSLRNDSAALLAYLDHMPDLIPSLSEFQAYAEDLQFQAKVRQVAKKVTEVEPAVWREGPSSRP